jgi:hypothetical protein
MRKILPLRPFLVLSLWSGLILTAHGQGERASADRHAPETVRASQIGDIKAFDQAMAEIKLKQPAIPDAVLAEDVVLIKDALPEITTEFWKVGLSDDDALWASLRAWKTARLESPLRLNPTKSLDKASFITHTTNDVSPILVRWYIQEEKPEISNNVLQQDLQLIKSSQGEITAAFNSVGWTEQEAQQASLAAWKVARLESPLGTRETLDRSSFIALATSHMGALVFVSEPDAAEVYLGTSRIGTTNKDKKAPLRWFQDGEVVTVRFIKANFVSEERQCTAKAREAVECKADLKQTQ